MPSRQATCPHCSGAIFIDTRITSRVLSSSPSRNAPKYPWLKKNGAINEAAVDNVRVWLTQTELAGPHATSAVYEDYRRLAAARKFEPLSHVSLVTVLDHLGVGRRRTAAGSIITIPPFEVDPPPWEESATVEAGAQVAADGTGGHDG